MSKKLYPSDLTREKFLQILPILESAKKKTRPRQVDLYDVFNVTLYFLKSGCQFRALPHEYPNWKMVHKYFTIWNENEVLDKVLKKINWRGSYKQWTERQD